MKKLITNSEIKGVIEAPASKSIAQRAIIAALLARGKTSIKHLTPCDDTLAALNIARQGGCHITHVGNDHEINSPGAGNLTLPDEISCGESGLLARVMIPIASLDGKDKRITGHGTLLARPVDTVLPPLSQLGVTIQSPHGHLPLTLKGPLKGGKEIQLDGSLSSQFLTGLLMALPLAPEDSSIRVNHLKSKPYIDLTIDLLSSFGIEISREDDTLFTIRGRQAYQPCTYTIEGDWSGASCLLVAGAIAGEITIKGLDIHTRQADVAILKVLEMAGIPVSIQPDSPYHSISVHKSPIRNFNFDATECPDLFPALAALAARAEGTSTIKGVRRLLHKESDRATVLQEEFQKLGIQITTREDLMIVTGGTPSGNATLHSHQDHRVAMALATVALRAKSPLQLEDELSVNKSFPDFWDTLDQLKTK